MVLFGDGWYSLEMGGIAWRWVATFGDEWYSLEMGGIV